ncbi:hypothetical protein CJ030_MR5G025120 [Morella rubra]|uniref:RNase H type-1 domain-containing protein n=1 Tax=Morella rubra TaxID=262757 RepID=A0A6A1VN19_9ROSI|nr:hypothetical protein CJ030_MR5G025118 [Morella rubra]KAB1212352.1 hypothetical protein CJ030_MR5G025120 [Morella rubra]
MTEVLGKKVGYTRGLGRMVRLVDSLSSHQNNAGQILFAWSKRASPGTPLVGEAKAALFAVQEASFLDYPLIEFEGDNLQVCNALSLDDFQPDWSISSYILDAKALSCNQSSRKVHHVGRDANRVAHNLAKWAARENVVGNIPVHCIPLDVLNADNPPHPP